MITKAECAVLAGMFGVTNMGMQMPDTATIKLAKEGREMSPSTSAYHFAQQYMEEDSHEELFIGEVKMWIKELSVMTWEEIDAIWPDHVAAYKAA